MDSETSHVLDDGSKYEWFVALSQEAKGPFKAEKLKQMFEDCEIDGLTFVWRNDADSWTPLGKDEILKSYINNINGEYIEKEDPSETENFNNDGFEGSGDVEDTVPVDKSVGEAKIASTKKQQYLKRKRERMERGEFINSKKNFSVYITGLPKDVTVDELQSVFRKAGVIKIDPNTTLPKIKIYRDDNNVPKGDATITFLNRESVALSLKYFDDYYFRPDVKIHVEEAEFKPNPNKKLPQVDAKLRKKKFLAAKYEAQRNLSWQNEVDDGTGRRVVLAKPMFSLEDAEKHSVSSPFYETLRLEIYEEVKKYVNVDKITPMARHPQGIVCFRFKSTAEAEIFISIFNNRIFDGNKLEVYFYDGKTDLSSQCLPDNREEDSEDDDSDSDNENIDSEHTLKSGNFDKAGGYSEGQSRGGLDSHSVDAFFSKLIEEE